jgi:hypothetical protein
MFKLAIVLRRAVPLKMAAVAVTTAAVVRILVVRQAKSNHVVGRRRLRAEARPAKGTQQGPVDVRRRAARVRPREARLVAERRAMGEPWLLVADKLKVVEESPVRRQAARASVAQAQAGCPPRLCLSPPETS